MAGLSRLGLLHMLLFGIGPSERLPACFAFDECEECPYYYECVKARLEDRYWEWLVVEEGAAQTIVG